jgi:hypothetical protein
MYSTSFALRRVFMGTMTNPASGTAKVPSSIDGMFGHRNAIRSPLCRSEPLKREARRLTLSSNSL